MKTMYCQVPFGDPNARDFLCRFCRVNNRLFSFFFSYFLLLKDSGARVQIGGEINKYEIIVCAQKQLAETMNTTGISEITRVEYYNAWAPGRVNDPYDCTKTKPSGGGNDTKYCLQSRCEYLPPHGKWSVTFAHADRCSLCVRGEIALPNKGAEHRRQRCTAEILFF